MLLCKICQSENQNSTEEIQNSSKETKKPAFFVPIAQKAGGYLSSLVHIDFCQQLIHGGTLTTFKEAVTALISPAS